MVLRSLVPVGDERLRQGKSYFKIAWHYITVERLPAKLRKECAGDLDAETRQDFEAMSQDGKLTLLHLSAKCWTELVASSKMHAVTFQETMAEHDPGLVEGAGLFQGRILGPDHRPITDGDSVPPDRRLAAIADALSKGEPASVTVRTLLSWFNASRRRSRVVDQIRGALSEAGLVTDPDFESAYIDLPVSFRAKQPPVLAEASGSLPIEGTATSTVSAPSGTTEVGTSSPAEHTDPAFRLGKLEMANRTPTSIKPDAPLSEAVTLMLLHDYSQLPVMQGERDVKGAVSWQSIASRLALGHKGLTARDLMDPVEVIDSDASLFDAIRKIMDRQYVLVRGSDRRITGIVTASDLAGQFQLLTEPFLLLGEIENELRRKLAEHFELSRLIAAKDPADTSRAIETVHDLTFGEYVRFLEVEANWADFAPKLDRREFVNNLRRVGIIRNDVMHFDPEGIEPQDLELLRKFSKLLREVRVLEEG